MLSRSHGRSFRIRHEKSLEVPPNEEMKMTSYPAINKTSLSRKPCFPAGKLLRDTMRKSWSLYQNPSWKIAWSAPWRRNYDDVISGWQWNFVISETMHPRWKVTIERYQEVMVALSETVMKNLLKRLLSENSRWRHIRLAVKPRYLGSHASHINSYYGTLLGSYGPSLRIRHDKSFATPSTEEITMTSYPAINKTSLSRKPCIPAEKLLRNTMSKSWSLFQNPSWKIAWSAPWHRNDDDVFYGLQ